MRRKWKRKENTSSNYRTSQNIIIDVFLESQLSASFPLLWITVHLISLSCPPVLGWSLDQCGGSSDSNLVLLLCVLASNIHSLPEPVNFLLWKLSLSLYVFHRHRVCLVDCVDWICSLYTWWEDLGSSCSATLPLDFNCHFIFTSAGEFSTGFASEAALLDPGPLWGPGMEVAQLLGLQQPWQHQALRGAGS